MTAEEEYQETRANKKRTRVTSDGLQRLEASTEQRAMYDPSYQGPPPASLQFLAEDSTSVMLPQLATGSVPASLQFPTGESSSALLRQPARGLAPTSSQFPTGESSPALLHQPALFWEMFAYLHVPTPSWSDMDPWPPQMGSSGISGWRLVFCGAHRRFPSLYGRVHVLENQDKEIMSGLRKKL